MKKALIFLLIFFILLAAVAFILNLLGIVPIAEIATDLLERIPFITTIQELREENELLQLKLEVLEYELEEVMEKYRDLERQKEYVDLEQDERVQEITRLEGMVRELERALTFREERLDSLIGIYREMDPEDVASILVNLDDPIIIQVLTSLRASDAADILTYIPSERAATISRDIFMEEGR